MIRWHAVITYRTDHIGMTIFSSDGACAWRAPHYSADEPVALFSGAAP